MSYKIEFCVILDTSKEGLWYPQFNTFYRAMSLKTGKIFEGIIPTVIGIKPEMYRYVRLLHREGLKTPVISGISTNAI